MVEECELYYYYGLYLNKEDLEKLAINKATGMELLSLMRDYCNVVSLADEGKILCVDKNALQANVVFDKEYCYMIRKDILILPDVTIYYSIKMENRIIAVYESKEVRDAKIKNIKLDDIFIIQDMHESISIINEFNKQMNLKKTYNTLNNIGK